MIWKKVTLGDIASNIQTGPFGSQLHQSDYSEEGTPVVMPKDLVNGHISELSIARVSEDHVNRLSRHKIEVGDILYSRRGDVGRCAFATDLEQGWLCGTGCLRVTIDSSKAVPKFVFYQLQKAETVGWVEKHAVGATMLNLNTSILSSIPIEMPSIEAQQIIVDMLSAYDDLIENNQKQIKLLEEAAQRLYKEWFVDLRFPGHETTPITDGIPEGWEITSIGDIGCNIESGSRPKGGIDSSLTNGIPSIGAENVIGLGKYNYAADKFITDEFYSSMKRGKLKNRDILVYKDGAYIGRTSLFQDGFPHKCAAVNEHVFLLHTENELFQYYLFFTLYQYEYFQKMQKLNKNAAQPGINAKAMLSLDVVVPPLSLIQKFDDFVSPIMRSIFAKANQNRELSEARDRLLPKLMNGEIEV